MAFVGYTANSLQVRLFRNTPYGGSATMPHSNSGAEAIRPEAEETHYYV